MQGFKVALLVIVALLLLVFMADRTREPEQMKALAERLDSTKIELERLRNEQKRSIEAQESLVKTMERLSFPWTPCAAASNKESSQPRPALLLHPNH